jgi:hypothetical protein
MERFQLGMWKRQDFLIQFDFTNTHLQDDGANLLFHTGSLDMMKTLRGFMKVYCFKIHKEWMGVNWLRMTSAKEVGKTVSYFSPCFMY